MPIAAGSRSAALGFALALSLQACVGGDAQGHDAGAKDGGAKDAASKCAQPLAKLPLDCQVTFMPTYSSIYTNLLVKTCGAASTGASCHGPSGKQSGLLLSGKDAAYDS